MPNENENKKPEESNIPPATDPAVTGASEKVKEKDEKVTVSKKALDAILDRLEAMEKKDAEKDKKIEMLTNISDKARLAKYEEQSTGKLIRTARISFWKNMPVVGWQTVKNEVGFIEGRLRVNQVVRLFMDNGTKEPVTEEVDYLYWAQNIDGQSGEVVNRSTSDAGEFWTVELKDGRKITVDIRFINAF